MSDETLEYRHSGRLGLSPILMPTVGMIGAVILGVIYAYACVWNPLVYIAFILVFLYGFAVGGLVGFMGKLGKCRNMPFLFLVGFGITFVSFYISWAIFIIALSQRFGEDMGLSSLVLLVRPDLVIQAIIALNETGWVELFGSPFNGWPLWIAWVLEAAGILLSGTLGAGLFVKDAVFCEQCGSWCTDGRSILIELPEDDDEFEEIIEGSFSKILKQHKVGAEIYPRLNIDMFNCNNCKRTKGYHLNLTTMEVDDNGNTTIRRKLFRNPG